MGDVLQATADGINRRLGLEGQNAGTRLYVQVAEDRPDGRQPGEVTEALLMTHCGLTPAPLQMLLGRVAKEGWMHDRSVKLHGSLVAPMREHPGATLTNLANFSDPLACR